MRKSAVEVSKFIVAIGRGQSEPPELGKNRNKTDIVKTEDDSVVAKRCRVCGEVKLRADMSKVNSIDKMGSKCKECINNRYVKIPYQDIIGGVEVVGTLTKNQRGTDIIQAASGEVIAKRCSKCGEMKVREDMEKLTRTNDEMNSSCKQCAYQRTSSWSKVNSEKVREYSMNYRKRNPEKVREAGRNRYKQNLERFRERARKFREQNLEKERERQRVSRQKRYNEDPTPFKVVQVNRRAMKAALPDTLTTEQYNQNVSFFDGCCTLTGEILTKKPIRWNMLCLWLSVMVAQPPSIATRCEST
ncbi:hypothetical protein [Peribacillus frigoritolerans]|uniref:Uncharacterized protein n=1 Tax=Peribacillus frigoritolerans TaxID=450367 RepID=A0AAJ1QKJ9_9BACI|nr:hypothetical protein [Peribacillus frigoritolerans]MDM5283121.1 hypothetical protein [Peribacillus frigoritolerans]